jgi:hypothetical protein
MKLLMLWKLWLALAAFTMALNHAIQVYDAARDARRDMQAPRADADDKFDR